MKLLLTAEEHAEAVEQYLDVTHGIMVSLQGTLDPIDIDFDLVENTTISSSPAPVKQTKPSVAPAIRPQVNEDESVDEEREEVIARAEELGISFRSDIKTDTLIKRIEEREEELVEQAQSDAAPGEVDLDAEDDLSQEIPKAKKTIEEMIAEDEAMDAENEEDTTPVRKGSMFNVKAKQAEADDEEEVEQPKKRSTFFDKLNKGK